jgi:hypothetical protein
LRPSGGIVRIVDVDAFQQGNYGQVKVTNIPGVVDRCFELDGKGLIAANPIDAPFVGIDLPATHSNADASAVRVEEDGDLVGKLVVPGSD